MRAGSTERDAPTTHHRTTARSRTGAVVSVVLPVFNERAALSELVSRLVASLKPLGCEAELVFIDDGSTDGSGEWLDGLMLADAHVVVLHLSRNFGHQAAVQAGLTAATGDTVVVMDSDLQDDPRAISRFLEEWEQGFDVVYAVRVRRKEAWWKRLLFAGFYRLFAAISEVPPPRDAGNFGLLDRRVVQQILSLPERQRYFPGLRNWVGYRQIGVPVERLPRHDGVPRVSLFGLCRLAKTAIVGFSAAPMQAFSLLAVLSGLFATTMAAGCLTAWLTARPLSPGWLSVTIAAAFGSLNALGIAMLGEYLLQILDQVRGRPTFCVDRTRRSRPTRMGDGANREQQLALRDSDTVEV